MVKIIWRSYDYCVFLHPDNLLIIAQFFCGKTALVVGNSGRRVGKFNLKPLIWKV